MGVFTLRSARGYAAEKKKEETWSVLMIGNSLTKCSGNTTIENLNRLSRRAKVTLKITTVTYGGECLETYANEASRRGKTVRSKIDKGKWDVVILQQETDHAVTSGTSFRNAAEKLGKYIRKKSPKARIILNATWGYKGTRRMKGKSYSHSSQQEKINKNCKKAAKAIGAEIVYTGNAFDIYKAQKKHLEVHAPRHNHATAAGWYINACSLYVGLFHQTPYEARFYGGLGRANAWEMQKAAEEANGHLLTGDAG